MMKVEEFVEECVDFVDSFLSISSPEISAPSQTPFVPPFYLSLSVCLSLSLSL